MRVVTVLAVLLVTAAPAIARTPKPEEFPSLDAVVARLESEIVEAERAAAEAARDEDREFLRAYQAGARGDRRDHERIVAIVDNRAFDRDKPGIREQAAAILKERWSPERPNTMTIRKELSRLLVRLLSRTHDEKANRLAIDVLRFYWGTDRGYKLDASWRDKNKAIRSWTEAL